MPQGPMVSLAPGARLQSSRRVSPALSEGLPPLRLDEVKPLLPHPDRRCHPCHPHLPRHITVSEHQARMYLLVAMWGLWLVVLAWMAYKELEISFPEASEWMWCGGVTTTTATFRVVTQGTRGLGLVVSRTEDLATPVWGPGPLPAGDPSRVHELHASGLAPGTPYYYGVVCDGTTGAGHGGLAACGDDDGGELRGEVGQFQTTASGAANLTLAFASCADTGSREEVFASIAGTRPDLFIHMGDLHYSNIAENDPAVFQQAFARVMGSPSQRELFHSTAVAYMWDDHDYGPNDATSLSPSKSAAREAYQRCVPHYPLRAAPGERREGAGGDGWRDTWQDTAIYQAFTMGRVRVILTDLRSESVPRGRIMGAGQMAWLKSELARAHEYVAVVWVSTVPWIGPASEGSDSWPGHVADREEIGAFIAANVTARNVVMLAGDAHMLAIDDGSHSDYAPGGGGGFPVMQAAPMDRPGSTKGGPFSVGCRGYLWEKTAHFGILRITDPGGPVEGGACLDFEGYKGGVEHRGRSPIIRYSKCAPLDRRGEPGAGSCFLRKYPVRTTVLLWLGVVAEAVVLVAVVAMSPRYPWTRWAAGPVVGFAAADILVWSMPVVLNYLVRENMVQLLLPAELLAGMFITHAACVAAYVVFHPEVYQVLFRCCGCLGPDMPLALGGSSQRGVQGLEMMAPGVSPAPSMERLVGPPGSGTVSPAGGSDASTPPRPLPMASRPGWSVDPLLPIGGEGVPPLRNSGNVPAAVGVNRDVRA